jgi:hypothetical protein
LVNDPEEPVAVAVVPLALVEVVPVVIVVDVVAAVVVAVAAVVVVAAAVVAAVVAGVLAVLGLLLPPQPAASKTVTHRSKPAIRCPGFACIGTELPSGG